MSTALVPAASSTPDPWACLYDDAQLKQLVTLANTISQAGLVPAHLRGQTGDIVLALGIARAMGENPVLVLQSIYVINGRACWSAQYLIARANGSGRFRGPINWKEEGEGESLVVTAYATVAETGDRVEAKVSMAMAKAEGWAGKNKKYQTMPIVMLRYRSATLLVRQFCPDVLMGLHEQNELVDTAEVVYLEPAPSSPPRSSRAQPLTTAGSSAPSPDPKEGAETFPVGPPLSPIGPGDPSSSRTELEARVVALQATHSAEVKGEATKLRLSHVKQSTDAQLVALIDAVTERIERLALQDEGTQPEGATP